MRVSPLQGHRMWAATYDLEPNPLLSLEGRTLLERMRDLEGKYFFDAACGTGRWLSLARARRAHVFGIDFCLEMLVRAARRPGLRGCLALADLCRLPIVDGRADIAMCAFSLGYVGALEDAVQELARSVRHGGSLFVTDLHPRGLEAGWKRTFRAGKQIVELESHPYSIERLMEAGGLAGLQLEELMEPHFGEPESEIFRSAGKISLFDEACEIPAVLIVHWRRP